MSKLDIFLFIHVLAAASWVGGGIMVQLYGNRFMKANDPNLMRQFGETTEFIGTKFFMPASILTLVFGILLVNEIGFEYTEPFVIYGIAAVAFSALVGAIYLGPESGKIGALIAEKGPEDPEAQRRVARLINVSRFELLILIGAVFMMTVKPGT